MNKDRELRIREYFEYVELTEEYEPYFCSVGDAITIVIVGTFCGFRNLKQMQEWASNDKVKETLREEFGVKHAPYYCWLICLPCLLEPESMGECFTRWVMSLLYPDTKGYTVSMDRKNSLLDSEYGELWKSAAYR